MSEIESKLDRAIAEAAEIEDDPDRVVRADTKITRGARGRVLQVRLNDEEMAAIESLAEERGLPVSTLARDMLLRCMQDPAEVSSEERQLQANLTNLITTLTVVRDHPVSLMDSSLFRGTASRR
ncbi:MAG: DUF6290 family protein [Gordonia sp. (in: high G+C Gram-positive bacteria)]